MSKKVAVGIDLGTRYSCVALIRDGRVEIIANDLGNRRTPSFVAFNDEERLLGEAAKGQANVNPQNTIFEAKRLIGRKFEDESVQSDMKQWPFKVFSDAGTAKISIHYKNKEKILTPEEISSMVLIKMKGTAEDFLGCPVTDAVITVPAYFNDSQRQATKDAGEIAGFNVLSILNEPTAAAIAYGIDHGVKRKKNIVVYDLGDQTFDVTVLSVSDGVFDVKAVSGDIHLGGRDFDSLLMKHFLDVIQRKFMKDISSNQKMGQLRRSCKEIKRELSASTRAILEIDCLFDEIDFHESITRVRFENLCSDLFKQTMDHVAAALSDAEMTKNEIDEVVLVGGSSRIPKIRELLQEFFNGKKLNISISPDEVVAYGAAVRAAMQDIVPLTLSIKAPDGTVKTVLKRGTKLPTRCTVSHTTVNDNYQPRVSFEIYEGESSRYEHNNFLGVFYLDNIEHAKGGMRHFELTYGIDENGILHVSAIDKKTGSANGIIITTNKSRLDKLHISRITTETKVFQSDNQEVKERNKSKEQLELYCSSQQKEMEALRGSGSSGDAVQRDLVTKWCQKRLDWIENNKRASQLDYEKELVHLTKKCSFILKLRAGR